MLMTIENNQEQKVQVKNPNIRTDLPFPEFKPSKKSS